MRTQPGTVLSACVLLVLTTALAVLLGLYAAEKRRRGGGNEGHRDDGGNAAPTAPKTCAADYSAYAPMVTCNAATGEPAVSCAALGDEASRALCAERVTPTTLPTIDGAPEYACYDQRRRALVACDRAKASCVKGACVPHQTPPRPPSVDPTDPESDMTTSSNKWLTLAAAVAGVVIPILVLVGAAVWTHRKRRRHNVNLNVDRIVKHVGKPVISEHANHILKLMDALHASQPSPQSSKPDVKDVASAHKRCLKHKQEGTCESDRGCKWREARNMCGWNNEATKDLSLDDLYGFYKGLQNQETDTGEQSLHKWAYENIQKHWERLPSEEDFKTQLSRKDGADEQFSTQLQRIVNGEPEDKMGLLLAVLLRAEMATRSPDK